MTIPSKFMNTNIEQINNMEHQENDERIFEENKFDNNNKNTVSVQNLGPVTENDIKHSLFHYIIASPIKPSSFDDLKLFLNSYKLLIIDRSLRG